MAAGLGPPAGHALISLLALNGLRVSEATGADIEHLGLERGHRTLVITRKGGKVVTVPLAPRTARAIDLAIGERTEGPVFVARPKLRPIRQAFPGLTWRFAGSAGWRSGYVKVSGIGAPMSSKACRWVLVGSVSISMVTWVPVYRTWLRVKVARCSIRPRKLR